MPIALFPDAFATALSDGHDPCCVRSPKAAGQEDRAFLEKGYQFASKDYEMWNREATSPEMPVCHATTTLGTVGSRV
jgi:hypothetical protein